MPTSFRPFTPPRVPFRSPVAPLSQVNAAGKSCDCAHHRRGPGNDDRRAGSVTAAVSALFPILLCVFCPACVGIWAPLLGALGLGFQWDEATHGFALVAGIALALGLTTWRARQHRRLAPLVATSLGGACLLLSHWLSDVLAVTLLGLSCLLGATYLERTKLRSSRPLQVEA